MADRILSLYLSTCVDLLCYRRRASALPRVTPARLQLPASTEPWTLAAPVHGSSNSLIRLHGGVLGAEDAAPPSDHPGSRCVVNAWALRFAAHFSSAAALCRSCGFEGDGRLSPGSVWVRACQLHDEVGAQGWVPPFDLSPLGLACGDPPCKISSPLLTACSPARRSDAWDLLGPECSAAAAPARCAAAPAALGFKSWCRWKAATLPPANGALPSQTAGRSHQR